MTNEDFIFYTIFHIKLMEYKNIDNMKTVILYYTVKAC